MENKDIQKWSKLYNKLVDKFVNSGVMEEPDKYEREDAFMSIIMEIDKGTSPFDAYKTSFLLVHDVELSQITFRLEYESEV